QARRRGEPLGELPRRRLEAALHLLEPSARDARDLGVADAHFRERLPQLEGVVELSLVEGVGGALEARDALRLLLLVPLGEPRMDRRAHDGVQLLERLGFRLTMPCMRL